MTVKDLESAHVLFRNAYMCYQHFISIHQFLSRLSEEYLSWSHKKNPEFRTLSLLLDGMSDSSIYPAAAPCRLPLLLD